MRLRHSTAAVAYHELRSFVTVANATDHIGVQAFDAVDESVLLQEFKGAVGRWRLRVVYFFG